MSKPSATVSWSTDTNYATGPETGVSTRLEPSGGVKAQGFIPTEEVPARWLNWALGALGDWTAYLNGLPTDPDFVDEDFAWGGEHTFNGLVTFNGGVDFPTVSNLSTLNVSGNARFLSGMYLDGTTNELLYANAAVVTPRARTVLVALEDVAPTTNVGFSDSGVFFSGIEIASIPLRVPRGAVVTGLRYGFSNGSGGTVAVLAELRRRPANKSTGVVTTVTEEQDSWNAGAGTDTVRTMTISPTVTVDNANSTYSFVMAADSGCALGWIEITYNDPGPRNG